jgi:hypothetical protein
MTSRLDKRRASCGRAARSSTAGKREDRSRLVSPIAALAIVAALVFFDFRETGQFGNDGVIFKLER